MREKAEQARQKEDRRKKQEEKEKKETIEQKAQDEANKWIDKIPKALEDAAEAGSTKTKVFWYSITIGGGDFTGTAINERTMELVRAYCIEQGLDTFVKDGEWNAPGLVHEYHLYVDFG